MQRTMLASSATRNTGSQYPEGSWMDGRFEEVGHLREGDGPATPSRVALHLLRGGSRIPQGDQRQGQQAARGSGAPLVDDPVVVGLDAPQRQPAIAGLVEHLAAEAGHVREAQGSLHEVLIHVVDAGHRVVAARPHIGVGDRVGVVLVHGNAGAGHHLRDGLGQILVDPPVHHGAIAALDAFDPQGGRVPPGLAAVPHNSRADHPLLLRQPVPPQVWGFDDVIVD